MCTSEKPSKVTSELQEVLKHALLQVSKIIMLLICVAPVLALLASFQNQQRTSNAFHCFSKAYDTHTICCFAATSHLVTMATLKKASKVIRLQKKAQRLGTQGQTQADADIVDVE